MFNHLSSSYIGVYVNPPDMSRCFFKRLENALLAPLFDEIPDASVVGAFLFLGKVAGGKLPGRTVIGDALTAVTVTGTSAIGAIAVADITLLVLAFHGFIFTPLCSLFPLCRSLP
jgi:hypothetical protein